MPGLGPCHGISMAFGAYIKVMLVEIQICSTFYFLVLSRVFFFFLIFFFHYASRNTWCAFVASTRLRTWYEAIIPLGSAILRSRPTSTALEPYPVEYLGHGKGTSITKFCTVRNYDTWLLVCCSKNAWEKLELSNNIIKSKFYLNYFIHYIFNIKLK